MKISKVVVMLLALAFCCTAVLPGHAAEKVKVGYLHTLAVDGQMWLAVHKGYFMEQGLELEPIVFTSGVPLMQALSGGSVDVAIMGAVISNFPSRGVGKIFLINDIEYDTAMLFARPETGAKSIKDIKGKKVTTVKGTTAHVFLHTAMKANGMDSNKDIELVSMDMAGAVSAFIANASPFVCTWAPFQVQIRDKVPGAVMLSSAKEFYPQAAIIGGWVAANKFYDERKDVLKKIIKAWAKANDELMAKPEESLKLIHEKAYSNIPYSDLQASWQAEKCETSQNWVKLYEDGTVAKWVGQVEQVFVEIGSIGNWVDPKEFFDPRLYLEVVKK
jgi:NitT/TauT family transport system substrate-binding protein